MGLSLPTLGFRLQSFPQEPGHERRYALRWCQLHSCDFPPGKFLRHASNPGFSFDESLDIIGTEPEALSRQFHLLQFAATSHGVNGLNFETEHHGDLFRFEQSVFLLPFLHSVLLYKSIYFLVA